MHIIGGWGRESTKLFGILNLPWQGFKKNIYKHWSIYRHGRTAGESFGDWRGSLGWNKRHTRKKISNISTGVLYQTREKITTRLKLPLHMIWSGRRDHLVGYMTPLAGINVTCSDWFRLMVCTEGIWYVQREYGTYRRNKLSPWGQRRSPGMWSSIITPPPGERGPSPRSHFARTDHVLCMYST